MGTECNLVDRLDLEYPTKTVVPLSRRACGSMGLTNTKHLLYVLDGLVRGEKRHVVRIDDETARSARKALEKMLQIS